MTWPDPDDFKRKSCVSLKGIETGCWIFAAFLLGVFVALGFVILIQS